MTTMSDKTTNTEKATESNSIQTQVLKMNIMKDTIIIPLGATTNDITSADQT